MSKKYYPALKFKWHTTPLQDFKDMLLKRRQNQFDNVILVTGARGMGKSTFIGKICFLFEEFNPFEQIVYNKEGLFKLVKMKNGLIWADEAVVNAARGNVMTRANKLLFEATTINRDNFNVMFFAMPAVEDFDSKILQYVSCWIHITSRGLGVMLLPANRGLFGRANWDLIQMKKIFDEFQKENIHSLHVPYWIFDNFRGYIRFGKLHKKQQDIIDEIKTMRKNENLDKTNQEQIVMSVKEVDNFAKYSAKKISELILKGEIRSPEQFDATCKEMKLDPLEMYKKCDSVFKHNGRDKTVKQTIKEYEKLDALIKF